jgi:transposase-like protein
VIDMYLAPGTSTAAMALEYGFNANLVRSWIRKHQAKVARTGTQHLVPVAVVAATSPRNQ